MCFATFGFFLFFVGTALGYWHPQAGTTFQIQYAQQSTDLSVNADAFDLDLEDDHISNYISTLHSRGKKVICYFSAGTWEQWRTDTAGTQHALGNTLEDWPDERWWDIRDPTVRHVIERRISRAQSLGCDAVDPDNVDGYTRENHSGLDFTRTDTVEFLKWMAGVAHSKNLAIGLKNALELINDVEPVFDFAVNEECLQYDECGAYKRFLDHNKAVFHIEYTTNQHTCDDSGRLPGMTTVLKHMNLNNWIVQCDTQLIG